MKCLICLLLLTLASVSVSTERTVIVDYDTQIDYWRTQAYVNLAFMQYKVKEIIKSDSLKSLQ